MIVTSQRHGDTVRALDEFLTGLAHLAEQRAHAVRSSGLHADLIDATTGHAYDALAACVASKEGQPGSATPAPSRGGAGVALFDGTVRVCPRSEPANGRK